MLLSAEGSLADAQTVAEQLHRVVSEPMVISGTELRVTMSVGVGLITSADDLDSALAQADAGLYRAKESGGAGTAAS